MTYYRPNLTREILQNTKKELHKIYKKDLSIRNKI
jgi:hypothetical protein